MLDTLWEFTAMDSLFFRDGRPMNVGESAWVDSQFPPSGQTLQGAIRAAILDFVDADIPSFQQGKDCLPDNGGSLKKAIGHGSSLGNLQLSGPFICRNDELFFPAPLDLVNNRKDECKLLVPADNGVLSDAGTVRFPFIAGSSFKTQEGKYISGSDLQHILDGDPGQPNLVTLIAESKEEEALADREPKVGLARNNSERTARKGMLFAIAPVRPRKDVSLHVYVKAKGLKESQCPTDSFMQKLGGEGKLAKITTGVAHAIPEARVNKKERTLRFKIVFLRPTLFSDKEWEMNNDRIDWFPEGFEKMDINNDPGHKDFTAWQGKLNDCLFMIISACIGKPQKIGGWNLQERKSNPLRSFIPAGTVFFCQAATDQEQEVLNLHNTKIGKETEYGFGHILIGRW